MAVRGAPDERAVRSMGAALAHRGPDAAGFWSSGRAALGHRRLSIIDLSADARQPLTNEDGTVVVVVNGEIYNFAELRGALVGKGHAFRSRSDSEVLVHLYEEHGVDCVAKLHGMFALAVWDSRAQRLLLARDRAGKKPLYYRRTPDGGLAFASELHALMRAFRGLPVEPDYGALDEYLTLQYVPSPRTAYKHVFKLQAAHLAVFEPGREPVVRRYWSKPRSPQRIADERALASELRSVLAGAVRRRLVADVPVGAFLSGGIDSSAVVALMATQSDRPVRTFSIGFPDAADSELRWARLVAERYGTIHHETVVGPDVAAIAEQLAAHHGEPFADSSAVATYCLARETRRSVAVALSGDGSDEIFGGYTRYKTARLAHLHDWLPPVCRPPYRATLRAAVRAAAPHVEGFVSHFPDGEATRYPYIMCQFTPEEKLTLLRDAAWGTRPPATTERFRRILLESSRASQLGRLMDLDWHTYLVDDINTKVDISSMAHALEVRSPFQDTEVVEFAAAVPTRTLVGWRGKRLLRAAVKDLVPAAILRRRKHGFALPLRRWMKKDLAPLVHDVLLDGTARARGLFPAQEVERLIKAVDRDRNAPDRVWTLLMLELWFREFVDRTPTGLENGYDRPSELRP